MRRLAPALVVLCLALGCSENAAPLTELVVVVDSDLSVPGELDELRVRATGPDGETQTASAGLGANMPSLPRSVVLRHEGGALGPFSVSAEGLRAGRGVVSREAEVSFVRDKSLVLPMHLVGACRGATCSEDKTCTEHGCATPVVDADELEEWSGEKPELDSGTTPAPDAGRPDAGTPDAGMCVPRPETCNGADDDCDGRKDDGFDLNNDENNCGRCGMACNDRRGEMCCRGLCTVAPCL